MKFINVCEKILNLEITNLSVSSIDKTYFNYNKCIGNYNLNFKFKELDFEISYNRETPLTENELTLFKELFESFSDFSEIKAFEDKWNCSQMLKSVLENKPIEDIMYQMIKTLTENNHFKKVGILFLNETLMRLKGVMFGEINKKFQIENLEFKSTTIYLKEKNELTDILFYDKPKLISLDEIESKNLNKFFNGKVIACGLFSPNGPIGLIIAQTEHYQDYNLKYLSLFARICSIAIELTKTMKRLDFAIQDINYFKESLYATDSLARIGKLSATVAHELKNPLVAIGGFVNRLSKIVEDERGKNYLKIISSEVYRLENIVTEILNYSKTLNVNKKKLYLDGILNEIFELLDDKLKYYRINFYKKIPDEFKILADDIRIKQVLINVLDNAIHSMEEGGNLSISVEKNKNTSCIFIKDTGTGIPKDMINKVFEPFFTTKNSGTGLGLPLSKKIMLAHKGDIKVENCENGVLVTIILPNN